MIAVIVLAACGGGPVTSAALVRWPAKQLRLRDLIACETALASSPHARAFTLDVGLADGPERWVVAFDHISIIDPTCTRVLATYQFGGVETDGPSLPDRQWHKIPDEEIAQMGATDRLPMHTRHELFAWGYDWRPVITLVAVGPRDGLRYGYEALAIACDETSCRDRTFAHFEFIRAPVTDCYRIRRAITEQREPLFVLFRRGNAIVVEQRYEERDSCDKGPVVQGVWRTERL